MRLNTIVTIPSRFMQIMTSIEEFGDLKNMIMEEVVGRLKTHEEMLQSYGEQGNGLPCCLLMPSGHHDPRNPTRGSRQAPQRIEIVMVVEVKE